MNERPKYDRCAILGIPLVLMMIFGVSYGLYIAARPYYTIEANHTFWKVRGNQAEVVRYNSSKYLYPNDSMGLDIAFPHHSSNRTVEVMVTEVKGRFNLYVFPDLEEYQSWSHLGSYQVLAEWTNATYASSDVEIPSEHLSTIYVVIAAHGGAVDLRLLVIGRCIIE